MIYRSIHTKGADRFCAMKCIVCRRVITPGTSYYSVRGGLEYHLHCEKKLEQANKKRKNRPTLSSEDVKVSQKNKEKRFNGIGVSTTRLKQNRPPLATILLYRVQDDDLEVP